MPKRQKCQNFPHEFTIGLTAKLGVHLKQGPHLCHVGN
jgi:hypothetical protein